MRFLITSVRSVMGRTVPWSFWKRPQALQRGVPEGERRHRGVVVVLQLEQTVGCCSVGSAEEGVGVGFVAFDGDVVGVGCCVASSFEDCEEALS